MANSLDLTGYRDRQKEVTFFFESLSEMYSFFDQDSSGNLIQRINNINSSYDNDDFLKILKSNALIMLYNLIESTISSAILHIYDEIQMRRLIYEKLSDELKLIWIKCCYEELKPNNTNYDKHREKAKDMVDFIITQKGVTLSSEVVGVSGNLDIRQIKKILETHGIAYTLSEEANRGANLLRIKTKRNYLAHGNESFIECGREFSIEELLKIKNEVIALLDDVIEAIQIYLDSERFCT